MEVLMVSQAVTAKGQITLKRDLLQHLGIETGDSLFDHVVRLDGEATRGDLANRAGGDLCRT